MIENLVDTAIDALLSTIPGLKVVAGMQDNSPPLETPYCVVYSEVEKVEGKTPLYTLLTTIEYVSISGQDAVAAVEAVMTAIDALLNAQPSSEVLATLPLSGLSFLEWQNIPKTAQKTGDRRTNVRELQVLAQLT